MTRVPIHQDRKEYQLRCLLSWHTIRQPLGCQLRFEVPPNSRVFQIKINERTALSDTNCGAFSGHGPPEANRALTPTGTQRQLTYRLLVCASRAKVLVEPTCAWPHHRPLPPRRPDDLVFVSLFVRADARFPWPHQGVAGPTDYIKNRPTTMSVRFVVLSGRPFGEMALQGIANQVMTHKLEATALPSSSRKGNVVGIWYEGCPPSRGASFLVATTANMDDVLGHLEVVRRSIVPIGKPEIALEDKLRVVELVHDNRSIGPRQSQHRFAAIIDQPMRHVQWNPKQISLPPPKT